MTRFTFLSLIAGALCLLAPTTLYSAPVSGSLIYSGGLVNTWSIQFNSSAPGVELVQAIITLPSGLAFDTQSGGFGVLGSQDFLKLTGAASVAGLTPNSTALRDGATSLGIAFSGFNSSAGLFSFLIDVDGTAILAPLAVCNTLPLAQRIACALNNAAIAASNAVISAQAGSVEASEIAGALVSLTFSGPGFNPLTLQAPLTAGPLLASATFEGQIVPEPASFALLGAGLCLFAALSRRRSS